MQIKVRLCSNGNISFKSSVNYFEFVRPTCLNNLITNCLPVHPVLPSVNQFFPIIMLPLFTFPACSMLLPLALTYSKHFSA